MEDSFEHLFVAYPVYLREKARTLRMERGLTIDELAERLALPRTTIYYWVRDIPIERKPHTTWPASARARGSRAMQKKYRLLREAAYQQGVEEFDELDKDPGFREFVCIYIGEGYKRNRHAVAISNSDPAVMKLTVYWLRKLSARKLFASVQFHADQDPQKLRLFWGEELGLAPDLIRMLPKKNSGQLNNRVWRCQHGVLNLGVNDTYLRARLQAWVDRVKQRWGGLDSN